MVDLVLGVTPDEYGLHKTRLSKYSVKQPDSIGGVEYYGDVSSGTPSWVISVNVANIDNDKVGFLLVELGDVIVHTGVHCTPLVGETMGIAESGTIRFSFGY